MIAPDEILALDLSLTASAWARGPLFGVNRAGKLRSAARLSWHASQLVPLLIGVRMVVLEGYAFGRENQAHQLGELGGVARLAIYQAGAGLAVVPPATLKVYGAGRGDARKRHMVQAARDWLGYTGTSDDEADALWLQQMAFDHYGIASAVEMPARNRKSLEVVRWPKIREAGSLEWLRA